METTVIKRKGGSGRKKIEIKKIENKKGLETSFSKRRPTLFKKAAELSATCGVDVAVIVRSPGGNIFASGGGRGRSSVTSIVDRYIVASTSSSTSPNDVVVDHDEDEQNYVQILKEIEDEKTKEKSLMERQGEGGDQGLWWERQFDDLDVNELEEYIGAMEILRKNVADKVEEKAKAITTF